MPKVCCLQVYNSKKELKAGQEPRELPFSQQDPTSATCNWQDFKLVTDYEQKVGFHSNG